MSSSLQWLSGYLKFTYVTDAEIPLVANNPEYRIPGDLLYMCFVEIGQNTLQPTSTWALNSGAITTATSAPGTNWMNTPPGLPVRYAIEGRELILSPPPDAATVASFPTLTWRYIGTGSQWGQQGEIGLTPMGSPSLSSLDEDLVICDAAVSWLGRRLVNAPPDKMPAIQAQIAELRQDISRRLPEAKRRWSGQIKNYNSTARPDSSGRFQAARVREEARSDTSRLYRYTPFRGGPSPWNLLTLRGYIPE